ncbi:hypothetical protein PPACK8108_LOCUS14022 [Phakopsora pachyrhizi]|uniref:Uncharacterized protein n=1 Tax=Phakopsora pachyrhizi TaxID=170000 RepID=A0AAV0B6H3_PHAPC|nr:hypothetical protein PPACK8108_LOCUS14022 [Phakopsora pachyrhizi]
MTYSMSVFIILVVEWLELLMKRNLGRSEGFNQSSKAKESDVEDLRRIGKEGIQFGEEERKSSNKAVYKFKPIRTTLGQMPGLSLDKEEFTTPPRTGQATEASELNRMVQGYTTELFGSSRLNGQCNLKYSESVLETLQMMFCDYIEDEIKAELEELEQDKLNQSIQRALLLLDRVFGLEDKRQRRGTKDEKVMKKLMGGFSHDQYLEDGVKQDIGQGRFENVTHKGMDRVNGKRRVRQVGTVRGLDKRTEEQKVQDKEEQDREAENRGVRNKRTIRGEELV